MRPTDKKVSEWKQYSGRYFDDHDNICVKAYDIDPVTGEIAHQDKMPYELNIAHDSYDTWAFGVVLFELCAGIPLFLANSEDNILYEAMLDLYAFTDKYKKKRMSEIHNLEARNLVAQVMISLRIFEFSSSNNLYDVDAVSRSIEASTYVASSCPSISVRKKSY